MVRCHRVRRTRSGRWHLERVRENVPGQLGVVEISASYSRLDDAERALRRALQQESQRMRVERAGAQGNR